jgi:hypothetical protein
LRKSAETRKHDKLKVINKDEAGSKDLWNADKLQTARRWNPEDSRQKKMRIKTSAT